MYILITIEDKTFSASVSLVDLGDWSSPVLSQCDKRTLSASKAPQTTRHVFISKGNGIVNDSEYNINGINSLTKPFIYKNYQYLLICSRNASAVALPLSPANARPAMNALALIPANR